MPGARDAARNGLVIVHGLPSGPASAAAVFSTYPDLADRVARDVGWTAVAFSMRGAGRSPGEFSPAGWLADVGAAVARLREEVERVWLAGFGFGGTLALRVAADDADIGGIAVLGAPSDLTFWADTAAVAAEYRDTGLVPVDEELWTAQIEALDPLGAAEQIPPRPFLVVHGAADETVNVADARAIADASGAEAELRVIAQGGHRLRHDPRAVAVLLGWLQRRAN